MREIKFRAWDGKKMHADVCPWQWDFVISRRWHKCEKSTGSGILGSGGDYAEMLVPAIRYESLMQYTGLKDKNGVEIYEGDIVRLWEPAMVENKICEIKFSQGGFIVEASGWFAMGEADLTTVGWAIEEDIQIEVIGNLYEHPHLIPSPNTKTP